LDNHPLAWQARQNFAKLDLRGAIAARGFNVVDAQFERAMDRRLEIGLAFGGDAAGILVFPLMLIAHPPAGDDRHREFGATKTTVFHRGLHVIPLVHFPERDQPRPAAEISSAGTTP